MQGRGEVKISMFCTFTGGGGGELIIRLILAEAEAWLFFLMGPVTLSS